MRNQRIHTLIALCCGLLPVSFVANAQTTVNQLLDSTFVHGQDKAAELAFDDPALDYDYLGIGGTALQACKLTAFDGLFCLDFKTVRNWPHPTTQVDIGGVPGVEYFDIVDCEDPVLNLDTKKVNTCTGMTVDLDDNLWLAGKNKGKSHSLIKLVPKDPDCPSVEPGAFLGVPDSNSSLCAYEVATGRPLLVDLAPIGGVVAKQFSLPGYPAPLDAIVGLEERKTAVAFLPDGTVVELASGKSDWGLAGNEQLLAITHLQLEEPLRNYLLVTTTKGRVLAWDTAGDKAAIEVFDIVAARDPSTFDLGPCSAEEPVYSVRASSTTDFVYVTDSEYCEVSALGATFDGTGTLSLARVAGIDATFSTRGLTAVTGVTVAPGNNVDLSTCADPAIPCALVADDQGNALASLAGVQLRDSSISGLTLFQIEGMPDCRYVPFACLAIVDPDGAPPVTAAAAVAALVDDGVIVPLTLDPLDPRDTATDPGAQRLNITPLLPAEITELFPAGLPNMLLPRYVRGQETNGFVFGGFFGVTEEGVVFRDTFEGIYDVGGLAGASLGCADNLGTREWDVIGTVSERWVSASDLYSADPLRLAAIINSDCGTSRTRDKGWSFKPYNLEPAPCTFNPDLAGVWSDDGICALSGTPEEADDAVYAKMLLVMAEDYARTLDQLACVDADGNGVPPLDSAACLQIQGGVDNMIDKLHKCWDATQQPKQSSGDQNCQAFDSQLGNLQQLLDGTPVVEPDYANRLGELKARAATMRHVFETRFVPSLALTPNGQFIEN